MDERQRPVIGINANYSSHEYEKPSISTRSTYVDAVIAAGGIPIILPPVLKSEVVEAHLEACDGFVFIGGSDINPARYGEEVHPTSKLLPERREDYDFSLLKEVMKTGKPFLAICLGCQEVNVALGGTLIQDIPSETSSTVQHSQKQTPYFQRHDVEVEEGSLLHDLVGTRTLSTNSAHHQAVERPGDGARVVARCVADGIIEALEVKDYGFGLAVQWHPENLIDEPEHLALFEGLVRAAKGMTPATADQGTTH